MKDCMVLDMLIYRATGIDLIEAAHDEPPHQGRRFCKFTYFYFAESSVLQWHYLSTHHPKLIIYVIALTKLIA